MTTTIENGEIITTIDKTVKLTNQFSKDNIFINLKLKGNKITAVKLNGKFCNCENIETNFEAISWKDSLNRIGNYLIPYPIHYNYTYVKGIEKLLKNPPEISSRVKYLRTIILELERILYHLNDLGVLFYGISYPIMYRTVMLLRDKIQDQIQNLSANESKFKSIIQVGGISIKDDENNLNDVIQLLFSVENKITKLIHTLQRNSILNSILKDIGFISRETAKKLSIVGPFSRSAGIANDVRKTDPYAAYNEIDFIVPVSDFCDVLGEVIVKCDEIIQSSKIIKQAIHNLPSGELSPIEIDYTMSVNSTIVRTETPSGELFVYLHSKEGDWNELPRIIRITTPLKVNTQGILSRITGESLDNLAIILQVIGEGWIG
ncbi:MAG: hypothetical protein ACFFDW_06215 [Candidatus Thorarchaeota archaeon]